MEVTKDDKTKEFISKARKKHGNVYDYDKTKYVKAHDFVIIVCSKHGEFKQKAYSHLNGRGCPMCNNNRGKSLDEFLSKAKEIHKNKYDYSKVIFKNGGSPVTIICPTHGEFKQTLIAHVTMGQGCKLCGYKATGNLNRIGFEEFLTRAKKIHGEKYDYSISKDNYIKYNIPVKIMCLIHGTFTQLPFSHCNGAGCPKCSLEKNRKDKWPSVLSSFKKLHNDKYEYYPDTYKRSGVPMQMRCKIHNIIFYQTPNNHLIPQEGCYECLKGKLLNNPENTLLKMKEIHNNKYMYPDFHYNGINSKIKILCPTHGVFYQIIHSHLKGCGCQKCGIEKRVSGLRLSLDEFKTRAKLIHGNRYKYISLYQKDGHSWIKAKCPIHGIFYQTANSHISPGYGCAKCGQMETMLTTEEFIEKSKKKFGNEFDYSKTVYDGSKNKVIITCKKHGDFEQVAGEHIRQNRTFNPCPKCNTTNGEKLIAIFLEKNNFNYKKEFKIPGYSYRYDFCIPKYRILIEFDGQQHFTYIPYFHKSKSDFERQIEVDKIKNDLAKVNNYYLIRIKYTVEDINQYLGYRIALIYRYRKDGILFKNFLEFVKCYNLPDSSRPIDYMHYKTKFN